jgi:FAD/FMN-containing dehydrogenase
METGVVVIDTSKMKSLEIDNEKKTVIAGPGFKLGEFQEKPEHGLAIPSGVNATVGMVGQLLLGGQGYLTIISLRLVTCTGDVTVISDNENADLFWALRGGAGHLELSLKSLCKLAFNHKYTQ